MPASHPAAPPPRDSAYEKPSLGLLICPVYQLDSLALAVKRFGTNASGIERIRRSPAFARINERRRREDARPGCPATEGRPSQPLLGGKLIQDHGDQPDPRS
jgi:hypothetical protein